MGMRVLVADVDVVNCHYREQAVKSVRHVPDAWRQNQIAVTRWNFNNLQFTTDALPYPKRIRPARIGDGCMKKGHFARVRLWAICGHGDPQSQNDPPLARR